MGTGWGLGRIRSIGAISRCFLVIVVGLVAVRADRISDIDLTPKN